MNETVTLSKDQAATFAAALYPNIRAYIDAHSEEYEKFLKETKGKAAYTNPTKSECMKP